LFGDGVTNVWSSSRTAQHAYTTNYCRSYAAGVTVSNGWTAINTNLTVAVACQMTITKMQVKLNLSPAKSNADSASLSATLDLGTSYNVTNRSVMVDIGGTTNVTFILDAKGKGKGVSPFGSCGLTCNKKTGLWALSAKLAKGNWHTAWAAYGLSNKTVKPGAWVTMPVVVMIGDEPFADERTMLYTATLNKSGSAK
jgi:hypothetical protein